MLKTFVKKDGQNAASITPPACNNIGFAATKPLIRILKTLPFEMAKRPLARNEEEVALVAKARSHLTQSGVYEKD